MAPITAPYISATAMRLAALLVLSCGVVLALDVSAEMHLALLDPASVGPGVVLHLAFETLATIGLGVALVLILRQIRAAVAACAAETGRLQALRCDFDAFLQRRFAEWGLSPAEIDVALLTMRGLKITEIAEARATREGTIKSQLSTIFRKSGVSTRTEFVAQFMDEFLDLSAQPSGEPDR